MILCFFVDKKLSFFVAMVKSYYCLLWIRIAIGNNRTITLTMPLYL